MESDLIHMGSYIESERESYMVYCRLIWVSVNAFVFVFTGPIEQLPDYNRVRSAMYWLRL